ncbi:dienelactone hydrolase family protein [Caulobacter sp. RHG1]|uniref:dienelactone hydrolase family protein n=1 Tax=Caulobacter sp. (strain RHG1) TaxID=2545762 RepID=UPI001555CAF5|nr:dienelactone hydrolase family protein [Caulobacter sp. RHG1]NQE63371.1 Dienelactone hydrolase family protein [Caulobacter sp. RHG1]
MTADASFSSQRITLACRENGAPFSAWHAPAREARRGGIVMLHAIWGVTPHIRALSDSLADQGYEVMAPALLDAADADFPIEDTTPAILDARMALGKATGWGVSTLPRVQACIEAMEGPVFVMGFCFGGTTAWLAACRCDGVRAVSAFYGGDIVAYKDETPKVPTILHFGKTDPMIPLADVEAIRDTHPELPIHLYEAGHAFVAPSGHHPDSARLSLLRTLQLFQRSGGGKAEA